MDDYVSKPFSEAQLRQLILRWAPAAKPVAKVVADVAKADATGVATTLSSAPMPVPAPAAAVTVVVPMPEGGVETAGAIDMDMLLRMQKTHPTLVGRLVDTYLNYGPKAVQQMVAALEAENHGQLMMTAHSLKSSSANIGAMKLSAICKDLEHRLKSTSEWDGEKNLTAVCEVETAFFAVHGALTQLQSEIKAAAPLKAVVA